MKKLSMAFSSFSIVVLMASCCLDMPDCECPANLPAKLEQLTVQPSIKGWELYSWPTSKDSCGEWNYAMMEGSNRPKSYNEVTRDALLRVTDESQLKLLLKKFPANEQIVWVGPGWITKTWGVGMPDIGNLQLPARGLQQSLKGFCDGQNLGLTILP